ncbi:MULTISPECIES: hypothetical protein [Achromobacter]|uniref:hypothetical protein n=1 Tax=Achromobacter TaxID=222 RepID=UPI0006BEDB3C|nr:MULTISPECIES: hypothetical protein [Achromobacter]AMH04510.1 hypothetical protein AL509_03985 [Achromobacter xylosoxidans]PWY41476.1 hypothetical protein DK459_21720 [Achromobacter sp. RW408]CUJ13570.1 Uncharacterised protein [Achromobacter xylosoxidans]
MTIPTIPAGSELRVQGEHGPILIPFEAVMAYHGHGALAMLALIFQGLRGALARLETDGVPVPRGELSVVSGHPGPGVRDAFEFATRAVTRGCYRIDLSLPEARYSQAADKSYSFWLTRGERRVQAVLREGVLPPEFFALLGNPAPEARREHARLRARIAETVLGQAPEALFAFALSAPAVVAP